nr:hypothetical protein [Pseudobdellovibrionaceae bacterium]
MDQNQWHHLMTEDLKVLSEKYNNSSKKMSFLSFCLKGGYLSEDKYLKWAQNTYQLPKVNSKFFEENTPKMDLWKKWKDLYSWSEACIPIGEWDNHLLVGTLEPLPEIQKKAQIQFVLCKPADLEDWWKIYHPLSLEKASEQAQGQGAKGIF